MIHNVEREARQEFEISSKEIASLGIEEALQRFFRRHNQITSEVLAKEGNHIDCQPGCSFCCYYKVEARAYEIVVIVDYVKSHFSGPQQATLLARAEQNLEEMKGLSRAEQLATNQACLFLLDGQCSIYPVRPVKCRDFHATDVALCKQSFDFPEKLDIPNSFCPELRIRAYSATLGFQGAAELAGFDSHAYDLSSAFLEAFANNSAKKRLHKKKKVFLQTKASEALPE